MKILTRLLTLLMLCSAAYGQIPITGLPPAHLPLAGTEIVPMVQGPNTVQTAISNIFATSAPSNAPYLLEAATAALANSRVLASGANISLTDGGPGGNFTIATTTTPTFATLTLTGYTGMLIGNGASPVSVFGGITCTGGQVISAITNVGGGTCVTAGAPLANPTATIGLTVINGSATTAMRSDAAPPLSQAISPSWTGNHIWNPASGIGGVFNGVAGSQALDATGSATSGQSFGLSVFGGTTSADYSVRFGNAAATINFEEIFGDGHGFVGPNNVNDLAWDLNGGFTFNGTASAEPTVSILSPTTNANGLNIDLTSQVPTNNNTYAAIFKASTVSGQSNGLKITAGTTSNDQAIEVALEGNIPTLQILGNGAGEIGPNATQTLEWTVNGAWSFTPPAISTDTLQINAPVNARAVRMNGNTNTSNTYIALIDSGTATGFSSGLNITAGTNSADEALLVQSAAATTTFMNIFGDGHGTLGPNTTHDLTWTTGGNFVVAAPTSGITLSVGGTGSSGATPQSVFMAGSQGYISINDTVNTHEILLGSFGSGGFTGTFTSNEFDIRTANTARIQIDSSGGVSINAPSPAENTLTVTAAATQNAAKFIAPNTASSSFGPLVNAGTNSSDRSFLALNAANTVSYFQVRGDGAIEGAGSTAAALVDMSPDTGSFTGSYTGFSTGTVTSTLTWSKQGNQVMIWLPVFTNANSNTATMTVTGIPAEIQPAHGGGGACPVEENNGAFSIGSWTVSGGTGTFYWAGSSTGFTNLGTKGIPNGCTFAYNIN